jgi:hypothetical protein
MKDRRQFSASKLVQIVRSPLIGEFAMKRFLAGLLALPLSALAQSQSVPEPAIESNPLGTLVFVALFVGFCVVFGWMVWRNRGKKEDRKPQS